MDVKELYTMAHKINNKYKERIRILTQSICLEADKELKANGIPKLVDALNSNGQTLSEESIILHLVVKEFLQSEIVFVYSFTSVIGKSFNSNTKNFSNSDKYLKKNKRYIPTLANDGHHVSCYILRDKLTGRFVSRKENQDGR